MSKIVLVGVLAVAGCSVIYPDAELSAGKTEVVVASDACKSIRYAAEEMTNFLSRVYGCAVPIVSEVRPGVAHLFVGDSSWARAAGIDVAGLVRDAYVIKAEGSDVYVVGRDDVTRDLRQDIHGRTGVWNQLYERATLFGVYGFLDEYAGVRFYFPGELGEITPRATVVRVPRGRTDVKPDFQMRNYSWHDDGPWWDGGTAKERAYHLLGLRKVQYVRNRMQTLYIPCCHGENGFEIGKRFAQTHPEYFALHHNWKTKKYERDNDAEHPIQSFFPQLCHSSGVWDQMYADILDYFNGKPCLSGTNKKNWAIMTFRKPWVDVMPQDGFAPCQCEACKAAYNKEDKVHYASELIWGRTAELARKLKAVVPEARITQMAYRPYRRIPDFEIPDNVDVMVAESGPWSIHNEKSMATQLAEVKGWSEKLGHTIWMWTYPNKTGTSTIPGVPNGCPRAWAKYFQTMKPYIFGAFCESENDNAFFNQLSYYVFGKISWDASLDVEAILDEYHRLMFGAGAEAMAEVTRRVEEKWLREIAGRQVETVLGPGIKPPSEYEIYTSVYSPRVLAEFDALFDAARAKVSVGSLERRRIDLVQREYFGKLKELSRAYLKKISVEYGLRRQAEGAGRKNLLVNPNMESTMKMKSKRHWGHVGKHGWEGGWIGSDATADCVSGTMDAPAPLGHAVRLQVTGEKARTVDIAQYLSYEGGDHGTRLKPGHTYRISLFLKLDDVRLGSAGGGVGFRLWDDHNNWFPKRQMTGTTDWFYQEYEFTAGKESEKYDNTFSMYMRDAIGTVYFAGIKLEELPRSAATE